MDIRVLYYAMIEDDELPACSTCGGKMRHVLTVKSCASLDEATELAESIIKAPDTDAPVVVGHRITNGDDGSTFVVHTIYGNPRGLNLSMPHFWIAPEKLFGTADDATNGQEKK